jgi:DNA-binding phage protein
LSPIRKYAIVIGCGYWTAVTKRFPLYRALSAHGNPRLSTLVAVTKAMGLKLTVEAGQ